jgi:uncharacterized protein
MRFHAGEIEVQQRAGVRDKADEVGEGIADFISERAADFLVHRQFAILGTVDSGGRAWASIVSGAPGFISIPDTHTVRLEGLPPLGDPLLENLVNESHAAMLAIDPSIPRRVRVNGRAIIRNGAIYVSAEQVYGNCRRYIQERLIAGSRMPRTKKIEITRSPRLSPVQCGEIARADTLFIASDHPEGGADVSHKGGSPGFVQVIDPTHLAIPDYNGNSMFNTLGNIQVNPKAGLLFIDFESTHTLQIRGIASIDWRPERVRDFRGAERVLDFQVEEVIGNSFGFPLVVEFRQFSRFSPKSS